MKEIKSGSYIHPYKSGTCILFYPYISHYAVHDNWVAACIKNLEYYLIQNISIIFRPHYLRLTKDLFNSFDQRFVNNTNHCFYVRSNIVNSIVGHLRQFTCTLTTLLLYLNLSANEMKCYKLFVYDTPECYQWTIKC